MGDTRIRYGLALGRQNNFYTGIAGQKGYLAGTDGLFAESDTTPDVTTGVLFYTNNTSATTITNFDLQHPSSALVGSNSTNLAGLFEGKVIKILALDTATTLQNNTRLVLADSANKVLPKNGWVGLVYHNSSWYETERSVQTPVTDITAARSIALGATNHAITVTNNDFLLALNGTTTVSLVTGISGGYTGQKLILICGSGGANIKFAHTNSSGRGNIYFTSTAEFTIGASNSSSKVNCIEIVKINSSFWAIPGLVTA